MTATWNLTNGSHISAGDIITTESVWHDEIIAQTVAHAHRANTLTVTGQDTGHDHMTVRLTNGQVHIISVDAPVCVRVSK